MFKKVVVILSLILAILLALFFSFNKIVSFFSKKETTTPKPGMVVSKVVTTTKTTFDTIPYYDTIPVPTPVAVVEIPRDSIIDTSNVFNDYYTEKLYSFISSDSVLSSNISFKVRKNAAYDYTELFSVVSKTTTITNDIYHYPAFTFGLGGEIGYSIAFKAPTLELGAILTLKNSSFKFGYEFLHKEVKAGYFYNFSFQKSNGKYKLFKKLESKIVL